MTRVRTDAAAVAAALRQESRDLQAHAIDALLADHETLRLENLSLRILVQTARSRSRRRTTQSG